MRAHCATGVLVVLLTLLGVSIVIAQPAVLPENHYKVYTSTPIPYLKPLLLQDQFGSMTVTEETFDRFATPVEKHHNGIRYPMFNPDIHMDWWRIYVPQPERTVVVIDQFGQGLWTVKDARYLLLPSLKNVAGPVTVPFWNHYLCYDALLGPTVGEPVLLFDQFGNAQVMVIKPKYLCNPVQKTHLDDGQVYAIKDPIVHLACYQVENPVPYGISITTSDQFGFWQTTIYQNDCLCAPALKDHSVRTQHTTWGKVKALYR